MNLGQTMLTMASLVLLSISVLNTNRMIVESDQEMYQAESLDLSVNFAQSLLNEIAEKKFDVNATDTTYQPASDFTPPYGLGPSSMEALSTWPDSVTTDIAGEKVLRGYESIGRYNDVDDYNGYERTVDTRRIKGFSMSVDVFYVTDANTSDPSPVQTYYKKIVVKIKHPAYLNEVRFSTIVGYVGS